MLSSNRIVPADIPVNGLFGYLSYDAVEYFEKIEFGLDVRLPV